MLVVVGLLCSLCNLFCLQLLISSVILNDLLHLPACCHQEVFIYFCRTTNSVALAQVGLHYPRTLCLANAFKQMTISFMSLWMMLHTLFL